MCWYGYGPIKKASKDIIVYKYLKSVNDVMVTSVMHECVGPNDHKYSRMEITANSTDDQLKVDVGLHSYAYNQNWYDLICVKCIIPKGAKYLFNGRAYVSTELVYSDVINRQYYDVHEYKVSLSSKIKKLCMKLGFIKNLLT